MLNGLEERVEFRSEAVSDRTGTVSLFQAEPGDGASSLHSVSHAIHFERETRVRKAAKSSIRCGLASIRQRRFAACSRLPGSRSLNLAVGVELEVDCARRMDQRLSTSAPYANSAIGDESQSFEPPLLDAVPVVARSDKMSALSSNRLRRGLRPCEEVQHRRVLVGVAVPQPSRRAP